MTGEEEELLPNKSEDFKGKKILLVEDNELNREIAMEILASTASRSIRQKTVLWPCKR